MASKRYILSFLVKKRMAAEHFLCRSSARNSFRFTCFGKTNVRSGGGGGLRANKPPSLSSGAILPDESFFDYAPCEMLVQKRNDGIKTIHPIIWGEETHGSNFCVARLPVFPIGPRVLEKVRSGGGEGGG